GLDSNTKGVVVTGVDPDSTAADAGIGRGTVIVAVERHSVASVSDFKRLMAQAQNQPVLLTVNNGGATGFVVVQSK
ncbi:MAG TPA: PDZ domain-containing protein, partial [Bryobacteraceae bacterium]